MTETYVPPEQQKRGPGRPRREEATPPSLTADNSLVGDETDARVEEVRRMRALKPFGTQTQKLAYPMREGYHRHWFNDSPGRIQEALDAGYAHVKGHDGKSVARVVGVGRDNSPLWANLMEIPIQFWLEDKAREQERSDLVDRDIRRGKVMAGESGLTGAEQGDRFYVPSTGIKIQQGAGRR